MNNVWLQQETLRRAAKKIARNFFPKPARKDIYSTCLESGQQILAQYDSEEHGELWPWVFLNMLSVVDGSMCAMMVLVVCQSEIPWQKQMALKCLASRRSRSKASSTVQKRPISSTPATSFAPMSL